MSDAKIPPGPWKWTCPPTDSVSADERLVDANGNDILAPSEWLVIDPAARPVIEASAELLDALKWFVGMAVTSPMHPRVAASIALLKRLGVEL